MYTIPYLKISEDVSTFILNTPSSLMSFFITLPPNSLLSIFSLKQKHNNNNDDDFIYKFCYPHRR